MPKILGVQVSKRAVLLSLIHNAVEIVTMVSWLSLTLKGHFLAGVVVLAVGLTLEHILALAAGKEA